MPMLQILVLAEEIFVYLLVVGLVICFNYLSCNIIDSVDLLVESVLMHYVTCCLPVDSKCIC
jgi:hypothetical protein